MEIAAPFPYVATTCDEVISAGLVGSAVGVGGWEVAVGVGVIAGMNNEGSVIVVANNITSIMDLRGKTVGFPGPGTIQHVLFLMEADKEGLTVSY